MGNIPACYAKSRYDFDLERRLLNTSRALACVNPSLCLHPGLQLCPLPLSSLRFTFIGVLCIVFLHQGTYDLWAHLSAIIKQSLMKSRKVTSPCACTRVCVPVRLIFLRTHVQLRGLHKPRKLNGERSMTSSERLDSDARPPNRRTWGTGRGPLRRRGIV